jgi:hypothetical protein
VGRHRDRGDRGWFEVTGKRNGAIHDDTRLYQPWQKPHFVLSAGEVYDMSAPRIENLESA